MGDSGLYAGALEALRAKRDKRLQELRTLEAVIRQLEEETGESGHESSDLGDAVETELRSLSGETNSVPRNIKIREDQFFGLSQGEAAKLYLRKVGHAVSVENIIEGLGQGGCKVGGRDPKKTLYISLVRNPKDFVLVKPGVLGLREFYPGLKYKKDEDTKTQRKKPKKKAKKKKAKIKAKSKPLAEEKKDSQVA